MFLRPQSLGGPAGYVLVSGKSMLPLYHTGDLVLVERQSSYHVGDVIAYRVPKGDPMAGAQVIHRIIGGDAKHGFVVQGDNRTAPDVWRPKPEDIVGAKALRIPNAVVVLQYLRSPLLLACSRRASCSCACSARDGKAEAGAPDDRERGRMTPRVLIVEPHAGRPEAPRAQHAATRLRARRAGARRPAARGRRRRARAELAPIAARSCAGSGTTSRRSSASASIRARRASLRPRAWPTSSSRPRSDSSGDALRDACGC